MPKLNRDGVNIYYEVHGSGPPLLLTHGYSSTSAMWQGQIEALSKHHKLVLWDMRGHGQSDYPDDPAAYSEALTVADMAALLDEVGADNAIVGGLSLGGYMSLAFYRAHPERVRALLIIDTGPGFKKDEAREAWNKRAHETGDRFEREGLEVLKSASRERSSVTHRDASGLARAARGMLTQRDARVIERCPHQGAVAGRGRRRRHAVPGRLRLHGGENSRRAEGGDPGRRPRRQHRPAAGVHRRRAAVPRRPPRSGSLGLAAS
jgi:pimeloyl-ACP methyl ester carboxylesterase